MQKSRSKILFYISMVLAILLAFIVIVIIIMPVLINNLIFISVCVFFLIIDLLIFAFNEPDFHQLGDDAIWTDDWAENRKIAYRNTKDFFYKMFKYFKNLFKK